MPRGPTLGSRDTHPQHWWLSRTKPDLQRHPYTIPPPPLLRQYDQTCSFTTNVGNIVVNLLSQKGNEPNISSCTHSTPYTNFDVM
jgi:hypothetical protein